MTLIKSKGSLDQNIPLIVPKTLQLYFKTTKIPNDFVSNIFKIQEEMSLKNFSELCLFIDDFSKSQFLSDFTTLGIKVLLP